MRRRVLFAIGSRANYGSAKAVMRACADTGLDVVVLTYATAVLERYGNVAEEISREYDTIRMACHVEGGRLEDNVATCAGALEKIPEVLRRVKPDIVYVVGDRAEILPVAYGAVLMNVRLAQQMAGEVSGTIDESVRHAVTKLAHIHLAATEASGARLLRMGEDPLHVHVTGCPRVDLCLDVKADPGSFLMIMQHAVQSEMEQASAQMAATLTAVELAWAGEVRLWWPNSDPGCEAIVRRVRESNVEYLTYRSVPPEQFLSMLAATACIVGNSSSAIREGSYLGTPAVNVGTRQSYRERGPNVIDTTHDAGQIATAIKQQLLRGHYESSELYGDGYAGERIADVLMNHELPAQQKRYHDRRIET